LFSELEIVFFDTTTLYFEGHGGMTVGRYGHSKDHRPDERQMIVGAVLDGEGRPICCELWPGNTADVKTLIPVVDRLWRRFRIRKICIVADRGMISQETINDLEEQGWPYILGARMRKQEEVRERVLADCGPFQEVRGARKWKSDPAPLQVKEVRIEGRRYVVCLNEEEREHDAQQRVAIVAHLQEQLQQGAKSLVGNKGYRRYLKVEGRNRFQIDEAKVQEEARYDGLFVLRTNTELASAEVALQFKRLCLVEQSFRCCKSLLATRPIFHHFDETIRGHVFCSFLALLLKHELQTRLAASGKKPEWADLLRDLERVKYVDVEHQGKRYRLRTELTGAAGHAFQAAGVAIPPTMTLIGEPATISTG
jgi:transposase